jgi:NAD(P)-dependent dehydrogenase (short-subunit alcohol dehydrogenase family)
MTFPDPTEAFKDQVVVISGATGGIGRLACEAFIDAGAQVIGIDRDQAQGRLLLERLGPRAARFTFDTLDVADPGRISDWGEQLRHSPGRVNVLINNAGVLGMSPLLQTSVEEWDRLQAVNLRSVFLMTKAVAPLLAESSVILNMSSAAALHPTANAAAYSVSKAGVITFSKIAAAELAPRTRVNVICPGPLDTQMPRNFLKDHPLKEEIMNAMIGTTLLKRLGKPEEIVDLLMFLASHRAAYITGAVFSADGGFAI